MRGAFVELLPLPELSLWNRARKQRLPVSFTLELTARCNHNCRHCYINLPVKDQEAQAKELSFAEIKQIVDQTVSLGAIWCLLTGGEPLLREDFFKIYLYLKKKGLLVSVFTNATLITGEHISLFKKYPPRDLEVTVYGVTQASYERVTRCLGSFAAFKRGVNLLAKNKVKTRFKAMALRSNLEELPKIAAFYRRRTKDYFRFDPFLHLRFDRNQRRNQEIKGERLLPKEIAVLEQADAERFHSLEKNCAKLINPEFSHYTCDHLFHCGTGNNSFVVSYDGFFRLCSSLNHSACVYDLKKGSLARSWNEFVPQVRNLRSKRSAFLKKCRICPMINLCLWCPAHADLETGRLDQPVEYFCQVAQARANLLKTPAKKKWIN